MRIQEELKSKVIVESELEDLELITAVDTAYNDKNNHLYAAAVTLRYSDLSNVERVSAELEVQFPYIPALLAFREGPVILKVLSRLSTKPDLIIFAGHGIAHPRSFGMASHLGLITDIPSIGCARKCLVGDYLVPAGRKGSCTSLFISDVEIGLVFRTKEDVKPMFISPGHKCGIRDAMDIISNSLTSYRMPEPLRLAHLLASRFKRSVAEKSKPDKRDLEKNG